MTSNSDARRFCPLRKANRWHAITTIEPSDTKGGARHNDPAVTTVSETRREPRSAALILLHLMIRIEGARAMSTYNGHRNWDYWNVSLWIGNDDGLYNLARDCIRSTRTRRQAAAQFIEIMAAERKTKTPDGARYTIDKVMRAMTGFTK